MSVAVAVSAVLGAGLAGCTTSSPAPVPSSATSSASAPSSPAPVATFGPSATTPVALAQFDAVVKKLLTTDPQPHGRDVIDALVTAGFDKKAMEVTSDTTSLGSAADSIEFSVTWKKKDCLVGQVGSSGFGSSSSPVLSTGKCLVGTTRSIDW